MKQIDWKIIYTNYSGVSKRAINLLSKEAGRLLIREEMVYSIYVLPCEKEGAELSKNVFFVSLYDDSEMVKKYVSAQELADNGFTVKVMANPSDEEGRFVFLTAKDEKELFGAVVSFLDDYIPEYTPFSGSNRMPDMIFDKPLPECCYKKVADHKKRSIFTWGHSINDYRAYIDNMARVRLNEVIIWNDYIPVNIEDIIDYAHSYGISVVLGYSWGWREIGNKTQEITEESIEGLKKIIIDSYKEKYAPIKCDGIYFQSFTERKEEVVGGRLISEMVTEMVNDVAKELWKITPDLRLIFGLHATSVVKRLKEISAVDPRIEILWEDCGSFPFDYSTSVESEEKFSKTLSFIKSIMELRGGIGVGFAFKGVMMLDWSRKVGQRGPYILGENSSEIANHDRRLRSKAWKRYSSDWLLNGEYAFRMMKFINDNQLSDTTMCIAGTFDGGIYLPFALYADMFVDLENSYNEVLHKVCRRATVSVD